MTPMLVSKTHLEFSKCYSIISCLKAFKMISKGCLYYSLRVKDIDSGISSRVGPRSEGFS